MEVVPTRNRGYILSLVHRGVTCSYRGCMKEIASSFSSPLTERRRTGGVGERGSFSDTCSCSSGGGRGGGDGSTVKDGCDGGT